ncbi:holo-ACP synthase [Bacillaceae bacterium]
MIIGNGVDLVEIPRIAESLKRNDSFLRRILTEKERAHLPENEVRKLEYVAGRFAAKEALAKALGCGIGSKLSWQDISVLNDEYGKPYIEWEAAVRERFGLAGEREVRVHLSLSHTKNYALAQIILETLSAYSDE